MGGRGRTGRGAERTSARSRAARFPAWLLFAGLVLALGWSVRALTHQAQARGVAVIDARRSFLQRADPWVLPEWEEALSHTLAGAGLVSARDAAALEGIVLAVAEQPFVAEVGRPESVWPDGLLLPIRTRLPVACIRIEGDGFLPVAEDGTVLPGWSSAPHTAFGGWLPVIGPHGPALSGLLPGERLTERRHLDALAVAVTMWNELDAADLADLGRTLIDASSDLAPDGLPGGVRLDLEQRRRVLFGRPPHAPFPGELPWELKWRNVRSGLDALRRGEDWDTWDARWDEPAGMRREMAETVTDPGDSRVAGR